MGFLMLKWLTFGSTTKANSNNVNNDKRKGTTKKEKGMHKGGMTKWQQIITRC